MPRIVTFAQAGDPEVLKLKTVDVPEPGPGEVRLRIKAIGINRAEAMWRRDIHTEPVKFPGRLGNEAAGVVEALGAGITDFAIGDAVNVIPSFSTNDYGMYG